MSVTELPHIREQPESNYYIVSDMTSHAKESPEINIFTRLLPTQIFSLTSRDAIGEQNFQSACPLPGSKASVLLCLMTKLLPDYAYNKIFF